MIHKDSAASTVPENKDAPCNICGRGWPYHHDACAYKQTAIERDRYKAALELIAGGEYADAAENVAGDVLSRV